MDENIGGTQVHDVNLNMRGNGSVCPACLGREYVTSYSFSHFFVALLFFPLGLIVFFFPNKNCTKCSNQYGGLGKGFGKAAMGCGMAILIVGIVFGLIAIAASA